MCIRDRPYVVYTCAICWHYITICYFCSLESCDAVFSLKGQWRPYKGVYIQKMRRVSSSRLSISEPPNLWTSDPLMFGVTAYRHIGISARLWWMCSMCLMCSMCSCVLSAEPTYMGVCRSPNPDKRDKRDKRDNLINGMNKHALYGLSLIHISEPTRPY